MKNSKKSLFGLLLFNSGLASATSYQCSAGFGKYLDNGEYKYEIAGSFETSQAQNWGKLRVKNYQFACGSQDESFQCFISVKEGEDDKFLSYSMTNYTNDLILLTRLEKNSESDTAGLNCKPI